MGGAAIMPIVVGAVIGGATGGSKGAIRGGILGGLTSGLGSGFGGTEALGSAGGGLGIYGGSTGVGISGSLGQAVGPGLFGADAIVGGAAGAFGGAGGFVGDLPIDPSIGGGPPPFVSDLAGEAASLGISDLSAAGIQQPGVLEQMISATRGLDIPNANMIFDTQAGTFQPSSVIEGVNATGPMQGTINTLDPTSRLAFEQGIPASEINALGDVGGTTSSRIAGAAEYAMNYGPQGTGLLGEVMSGYKQIKDPLKLFGAYRQWQSANEMQKMYEKEMQRLAQSGFPHQEFYQQARDFFDPAKRYDMLKSNPAYMEAARMAEQAQRRSNARSGLLNSGYGDSLLADVVARNAAEWEKQMFGNIAQASGMQFNNAGATAQLAGGMIPGVTNAKNQAMQSLGDAVRSNQGLLPEIFKTSL